MSTRRNDNNEQVLERTSSYSKERRNFLEKNGDYVYYKWDSDLNAEVPVNLSEGDFSPVDGKPVTKEWIILLDSIDHDEDLGDRYENENRDYSIGNKDTAAEEEDGIRTSAIENIPDPAGDPFNILFPDDDAHTEDPRMDKLREFMETLTPEQIDLIYDYYGARKQQTQIAEEENAREGTNISRQTVNARLRRILNLGAAHFEIEPPKKQEHKRKK